MQTFGEKQSLHQPLDLCREPVGSCNLSGCPLTAHFPGSATVANQRAFLHLVQSNKTSLQPLMSHELL